MKRDGYSLNRRLEVWLGLFTFLVLSACQGVDISPSLTAIAAAPTKTPTTEETPTPSPTVATFLDYEIVYEEARCRFRRPLGADIECGYLIVPEDRTQPDSPLVRLHIATIKSTNPNPAPDPIVYLEGGPGGSPLEFLWLTYGLRFETLTENHDLILVDQRGIGLSEPSLKCPEISEAQYEILGDPLPPAESSRFIFDAIIDCRNRLVSEGINLAAYNSAANAADINDLRKALRYNEWNLYGTSYGTRLALTIMRDYGGLGGIRSVILDSPYPLEANLYTASPAHGDRAIQHLFNRCAAEAECEATYPDLETVFFEVANHLAETPMMVTVTDPFTGEKRDMSVGDDDIIGFLFQILYASEIIPSIPQMIYDLQAGDFETFGLIEGSLLAELDLISYGMHYSVQCHEEIPFTEPGDIQAAAEAYPRLLPMFSDSSGELMTEICNAWGAGTTPAFENEPVQSDLPTLIIAGEFDPITPSAWGKQIASNLSNSFFFEIPGAGHGAGFSGDCAHRLIESFLSAPTASPNANCLSEISFAFMTPGTEIPLVAYTNDFFDIQGVVPEGWEEMMPGTYTKGTAAMIQQAGPPGIDADRLLRIMLRALEVEGTPEMVDTHETEILSWDLYELEVRGANIDLAVAEGERPYIIILQATNSQRELFYQQIFLPALDALRPFEE